MSAGTGSVMKGKDVTQYVQQALETGFSHIDTAAYYQTEETVGIALRESGLARSDFYITTKFSGGDIRQSFSNSLNKLGLKHVDLYLIHNPALVSDLEGTWKVFEKIKEKGFSKSIGVSNFTVDQLQKLSKTSKITPAVNQILFHPYNYAETKPLLEYCQKHGIVVEAYSSLTPVTKSPGGPVDAPVAAAAKARGATATQIILLWVRSKGVVIVTTSTSKEHLEEYLAVADLPPLTQEEIDAIDAAGAKGPFRFAFFTSLQNIYRNRPSEPLTAKELAKHPLAMCVGAFIGYALVKAFLST